MATEYGVIVRAKPDVSGFDEELNSKLKEKKREIDIDVAVSEEAVKKLNNIDERFQKIKQRVDTGFVLKLKTEQADGTFKTIEKEVYKVTQQFKDASGEIQKVITYVDSLGNIIDSKVVSSTKAFQGYNSELQNATKRIQTLEKTTTSYINAQGQLVKQIYSKNSAGQEMITIEKTTNNLGQTIKETEQLVRNSNGTWKKYGDTLREVINDETKLAESQKRIQQIYSETNKYINSKGQTVTRTYSKDSDGTQHSTIQKEYEDELGKKIQEVTEYIKYQGKAWEKVGETSKKVINDEIAQQEKLSQKVEQTYQKIAIFRDKKTGANVTQTTSIDKNGIETITRVESLTDKFGNTTEKTTVKVRELNGALRVVSESTKEYSNQIAKEEKWQKEAEEEAKRLAEAEKQRIEILRKQITLNENYKSKEQTIFDLQNKTVHKLQEETKITTNALGEKTKIVNITDKWVDSQGKLHTKLTETTQKVDQYGNAVGKATTKVTQNVEASVKGFSKLGQSFSDVIVKVAKFYLASLPIRAMQTAITSAIQSVKDFDSALTEFKKVSDLSGDSLMKYTEKLEELGKITARTRTEMVAMATEFRKSGFTDNDEVAQLANTAALYQNIADEELSASDAASVLISQIKAFQKEGIQAEQVIDAINETANRNAVSTSDIGRGLTQAGAALSTYGNSFYETISLVTAGTEIFQGRSQQVARGLNTIASRIAKNEKALQKYGVEIYDSNDDLRSTYDILNDLSDSWDKMSKAEQVALGTTLAGVNQYKVFSAVMTNFDTAIKVMNEDMKYFNGSALRENERYMESIKAKAQAVKAELQEMVFKSGLDELTKKFLTLSNAVLKFQNYIGGIKPLLAAISGILITFNLEKILITLSKIVKLFSTDFLTKILFAVVDLSTALTKLWNGQKVVIRNTEGTIIATEGATVATDAYALSLSSLQAVIGLVTIAITGLIIGINAYNSAEKARIDKAHEAVENEQEQINKLIELTNKINEEGLSRESLNSIIDENLKKYSEEFSQITDLNKARERALELLEEQKKEEAERLQAESGTTYESEKEKLENLEFGKKVGGKLIDRKARGVAESYIKNINPNGDAESLIEYIKQQRLAQMEGTADFNSYATLFGFSSPKEAEEVFNYIENEYKELIKTTNAYTESLKQLGYVTNDGKLISIEDAMTRTSGSYGKGGEVVQGIYQEIAEAKKQYKLTDEEAVKVKENLKNYGYDVQKTVAGIFPEIVEKAQKAEDEINAFVDTFGLTSDQVQAIRDKMAETGSDDFFSTAVEVYPELEDGVNNYTEAMKEASEEEERSKELLEELGIKENALQKEIGMSSTELIRQADAWNVDETALYNYLKALNQFDESLDNTQSAYGTLQTAIDEYNSTQGYSIDTMQALLRLSPEYLTMLDDELNGRKSLKDSITDKIKAQALEAKQEVYNMAIQRLQALTSEDSKNANDENAGSFRNSVDDIDAQTEALNRNTKSIMQNSAFKSAVGAGKKKEAEQVVQEMQEQMDIIDKAMLSLGTDFSTAMGSGTKATKSANSALKEQNQLLKEQKQLLEEKKKQYDTVVSYIKKKIQDEIKKIEKEKKAQVDAIKEQIDALKDLKEEETNRIDEQIDKLKEQKEIEQTYWEEKIEAFKKQNEELEEQLEYEELLENLAKAKSKRVRVYKEGQGFVYTEDGNEVDKAQAEIDEYTRKKQYEDQLELLQSYKEKSEKNYEEQIKALEKLKDEKEKNYDEQIKALEKHQEEIEAAYDAQIAYFQGYLDKFTEQTDAYENETNRQLAIQLTGIDFEQQGWQTRLNNLSNFVTAYNNLLSQLGSGEVTTTDTTTTTTTTGNKGNITGDKGNTTGDNVDLSKYIQPKQTTISNENLKKAVASGMPSSALASATGQNIKAVTGLEKGAKKNVGLWNAKASGDSSIPEDGIYLVGDSPNQELVIGSKLNGSLMNLSEGSGVVNATSTRTLAGVLNQLGLAGNQGVNMSNSQNRSTNIQIGNISLPSVQNGKDFVDYLQNFSLQMTQEAFV